jgi:hypothetical protein
MWLSGKAKVILHVGVDEPPALAKDAKKNFLLLSRRRTLFSSSTISTHATTYGASNLKSFALNSRTHASTASAS